MPSSALERGAPNVFIDEVWPLFVWKLCRRCLMQFRREPGWRVRVAPGPPLYACGVCASNAREAYLAALGMDDGKDGYDAVVPPR